MIFKTIKAFVTVFSLLIGWAASFAAEAASATGTLGASSAAADSYTFSCPSGTTEAQVRVEDRTIIINTAATVFATFGKDKNPTVTASDTESVPTAGPWVTNPDGFGTYGLVVNKSTINKDDYAVEAKCFNSLGSELATRLLIKTDQ